MKTWYRRSCCYFTLVVAWHVGDFLRPVSHSAPQHMVWRSRYHFQAISFCFYTSRYAAFPRMTGGGQWMGGICGLSESRGMIWQDRSQCSQTLVQCFAQVPCTNPVLPSNDHRVLYSRLRQPDAEGDIAEYGTNGTQSPLGTQDGVAVDAPWLLVFERDVGHLITLEQVRGPGAEAE